MLHASITIVATITDASIGSIVSSIDVTCIDITSIAIVISINAIGHLLHL